MRPAAEKLVRVFILEGIAKIMKETDLVLTAAMMYHKLEQSDESLRLLLKTFIKIEENGHVLMEVMVEECLHEQITLFQRTLRLLPDVKYGVLAKLRHRTTEEQVMFESLSPV